MYHTADDDESRNRKNIEIGLYDSITIPPGNLNPLLGRCNALGYSNISRFEAYNEGGSPYLTQLHGHQHQSILRSRA